MAERLVVFVHGWSTTNTSTYGGLPERLIAEGKAAGIDIKVRDIFLSKYVSFKDEVRVEDIARALEAAISGELKTLVTKYGRFAAITHSTGGPVVREWHKRYYVDRQGSGPCPMRHLIMLAPANFGSALAVLGKSKVGRIKAWKDGVEPGTGVLSWLQLGSDESWDLNEWWIHHGSKHIGGRNGIFPFVLTGQTIDRKLYDHVNSYTGESGSDGVVRVAAANLNAMHVRLEQVPPTAKAKGHVVASTLNVAKSSTAPPTAMRIIAGASHSGKTRGIMGGVSPRLGGRKGAETVGTVIEALNVGDARQYRTLTAAWKAASDKVQENERIETDKRGPLPDRTFIHDIQTMITVRVTDTAGYRVGDYDLLLTGENDDPDRLPPRFLSDRQFNSDSNALTLFLNHDVMRGRAVATASDAEPSVSQVGAGSLGINIVPRPDEGFVHYLTCSRSAMPDALAQFVKPNQTTIVDVVLQRVVHGGVFEFDQGTAQRGFKRVKPGDTVV